MRIPRSDPPALTYRPTEMPTASGDWGAPGRALAQMGQAISGLGAAISDQQSQEDDFKTKLALTNAQGEAQRSLLEYSNSYTGKPEEFTAGWDQRFGQIWGNVQANIPQTPRSQRQAALYGAHIGNSFKNNALSTQQGLIYQQEKDKVEATVDGTFSRMAETVQPDQIEGQVTDAIRGLNAMIDQAPPGVLREQDKGAMRVRATQMALKMVEDYLGSKNIDPLPVVKKLLKTWADDPGLQGRPPGLPGQVGPQSGISLGVGKIAAVTDQDERKFTPTGYGDKMTGSITVNGNTYRFVNGGSRRGSIPLSEYTIRRFTSGEQRAAEGYSYRADAFELNDIRDDSPRGAKEDDRRGLLIHSAKGGVTAGCIGIEGDFDAFKRDMQAEIAKNGGKPITLSLGTPKMFGRTLPSSSGGAIDRSSYQEELKNPDVRNRLLALTEAEVGSQGPQAQQAFMETIFNRAAARRQSLWDTMHGSYFPAITHERTAAKTGTPSLEGKYSDIYKSVVGGSNISNYATGNASGTVGFAGGPKTYESNGERFGIEGPDRSWADKAKSGSVRVASAEGTIPRSAGPEEPITGGPQLTPWNRPENESGVPRDPERKWFVLPDDPKEKAAHLRHLISSGRQDIVHQLNGEGKDVVGVKAADKPIWRMNTVSADASGKEANSLDRGAAFVGPGWAKETISDWREGRIPRMTAPAAPAPDSPTQVAEGTIPAHGVDPSRLTYMKPSIQSEMAHAIVRNWGHYEALQKTFAARIGTKIDAARKVVGEGYDLTEQDAAHLQQLAAQNPDLMRKFGLDAALADLSRVQAQAQATRRAPPLALDAAIQRLDAAMREQGATEELLAQKKRLETLLGSMRKAVDDDPLSWAQKVRIAVPMAMAPPDNLDPGQKARWQMPVAEVALTPLNFADPDVVTALRVRAQQAKGVGLYYSQPPQFFTKLERDALKDVFRTGGAPMLSVMGKIYEAFGTDTPAAMKEFVRDAPEAAMMGKLMAEGGDRKLLEDAAKGLHLRVVEGDKFISRVDSKMVELDVGDAMKAIVKVPGLQDPVIRMANAVYEYRHRYTSGSVAKTDFQPDLYKQILAEVLGQTTDRDGVKYGGVGRQGAGWIDGKWSSPVLVPSGVRQDRFDDLVGAIRDGDVQTLGAPRHGDGTPLTASEVRSAEWISVGNGRYLLKTGTARNGDNRLALGPDGVNPFVVDLNLIMGSLRKRVPDLFAPFQ